MVPIDVPAVVRAKALAVGAQGWLDALPQLVDDLLSRWDLMAGSVCVDATEALVMEVTTADGSPAVLKVIVPRDGDAARNEATVLRLARGQGCARLLRDDLDRSALLLERLGPSLYQLERPIRERHEILASVASQLWRPAAGCGLPSAADKGRWLAAAITDGWERLDRPCGEQVVDHAIACAERRVGAHDDERAVLVHGDVHQWNTLVAGDGWKLVDPDGLLAEAEYDLGIVMREDPLELLDDVARGDAGRRARWLARRTGLDATAIWEWGVVERVSTGLLCTEVGLQPVGRQMLAVAEHIAAAPIDLP